MTALLTLLSALPPAVIRGCATPGSRRISWAICSARLVVAAIEAPSGVRMSTLYCDWSSCAMKFLPTNMNRGTIERITPTQAATTAPRCAMLQVSMRVYHVSRCLKTNDSLEEWCPGAAGSGGLMKREQSIGVRVKETSSETAMAKAEVKPNELMKRPTMPPMKPTGRNTASMVIWLRVNPMAAIRAKVEMIEVGMAMEAIRVVRILARKRKMTMAAKKLPSTRWCLMLSTAALIKTD